MDKKKLESIPYQLCPKCLGTGKIKHIEGNTSINFITCDVCNGEKVIPQHLIIEEIKKGKQLLKG